MIQTFNICGHHQYYCVYHRELLLGIVAKTTRFDFIFRWHQYFFIVEFL